MWRRPSRSRPRTYRWLDAHRDRCGTRLAELNNRLLIGNRLAEWPLLLELVLAIGPRCWCWPKSRHLNSDVFFIGDRWLHLNNFFFAYEVISLVDGIFVASSLILVSIVIEAIALVNGGFEKKTFSLLKAF